MPDSARNIGIGILVDADAAFVRAEVMRLNPLVYPVVDGKWGRAAAAVWSELADPKYGSSHVVILEGHVTLAPDFRAELMRLIEAVPRYVLALFYSRQLYASRVMQPGFVTTVGGLWSPGIAAPVEVVRDYLSFRKDMILPVHADAHDDLCWQLYLEFLKRSAWAPIPSLVHVDQSQYHTAVFKNDAQFIDWQAANLHVVNDRQMTQPPAVRREAARIAAQPAY